MTASTTTTKRRYPRAQVWAHAVLHIGGTHVPCDVVDVSLGGALLIAPPEPAIELSDGSVVQVDFQLCTRWFPSRARILRWKGSRTPFAVEIVMASPAMEDALTEAALQTFDTRRKPLVLVVDPMRLRRRSLVTSLAGAGFQALEARTPVEAIAIIEKSEAPIAAALIAQDLTQTGGCELGRCLADLRPGMRIVFMEDDVEPSERVRAVLGG